MKKKKYKYVYKGIRNYPIRIGGKIVRPGDIVELTEADFTKIDMWHFEALDTATTTKITYDYETEMTEKKTKSQKTKRGDK